MKAHADELISIRDMLRFAVSRFQEAGLVFGQGTAGPVDEAAFLILETLHLPVDDINPWADARLTKPEREVVLGRIEERVMKRLPSAYLTKKAYIQGVPFHVDERVIVPRSFIGELLFSDLFGGEGFALVSDPSSVGRVLDLCTGSGCLAILAARIFANAQVDAVELSPKAMEVARLNIDESGYGERLHLFQGDLFQPVAKERYDLILTNPPYVDAVAMEELPPEFRPLQPHPGRLGTAADRRSHAPNLWRARPATTARPPERCRDRVRSGRSANRRTARRRHRLSRRPRRSSRTRCWKDAARREAHLWQ